MSKTSLNDIWRHVNKEIGFYTKETFEKVPMSAGVYAWFYPLRVVSKNPIDFVREINTVLNYDASEKGKPKKSSDIDFVWDSIKVDIERNYKKLDLDSLMSVWNDSIKEENKFMKLRRAIMKASILMPPLYIGKTKRLHTRCFQHINGNDAENSFYGRFTEFALKNDISAKRVSDLLFVCIKTNNDLMDSSDSEVERYENLIEEILKNIAKPAYSLK